MVKIRTTSSMKSAGGQAGLSHHFLKTNPCVYKTHLILGGNITVVIEDLGLLHFLTLGLATATYVSLKNKVSKYSK